MMRLLLTLFLLVAVATAFTSPPTQPWGQRTTRSVGVASSSSSSTQRFMFTTDKDDKSATAASPLKTVDEATQDEAEEIASTPKNIVKDMNTGEVKEVQWVDPAMAANTNPLEMSWWAYILFGFPFILLLNDALHFLPSQSDGPLSFLTHY